jgi:prepilin-type N-terminal cleavage/methylation domain-containing protein
MPNTLALSHASQAGRTLIELLIAMAIGLVIVIGVSALYLSSSGISRTANQISTAEQAGQLALLLIGDSMKRAAYGEIIGSDYAGQGQTLMDGVHLAGCTGTMFTDPFPAYVVPPAAQTPPDLTCAAASGGDSIYVRYQAAPVIAQMLPADAAGMSLRDCGASLLNQNQALSLQQLRAGAGLERPMVTNVFQRDPVNNTLDCAGYGNAGAFLTLLQNVVEFRVFYRFDDAAYAAGSSGVTNAVPFGGSIRDAADINLLAGAIDPWNYVVAAMVCLTVQTDEVASTSATNLTAPRCPVSAAEAETGLGLVTMTTDGRIRRTFSQVFTLRNRATPSPSIL